MPPEIAPWVNFGVLGLVVASLIIGQLVTKPHADEIREQRNEAMKGWADQTGATKELTGVVRDQASTIAELKTQVAELLRRDAPARRGS